jgi:protease I
MATEKSAKTVACLLGPMFEDSEYKVPTDALREAGFQVDVIGAKAGEALEGDKGKVTARTDLSIDDVKAVDYDLLLIPGGMSPDKLRADERFVRFVRDFEATGRTVAAVCHGPQLLAAAHLVEGRTLTAWQTVQDDLAQMGAHVKDEPVVEDRNWITSRKPDDLPAFTRAVLAALNAPEGRPSAR